MLMGVWLKMVCRNLSRYIRREVGLKNKDLGAIATPEGNVTRKQVKIISGESTK